MWPQRVLINSGPSSGIKEFSNPDLLRTLRGSLPGPILLKVKVLMSCVVPRLPTGAILHYDRYKLCKDKCRKVTRSL